RKSSFFSSSWSMVKVLMTGPLQVLSVVSVLGFLVEVQPNEDPLLIGQIANQAAHGLGQLLDQGGRGDELRALGQFGLLVEVDDFQVVAAGQVLLAHGPQGGDGLRRAWRQAGDVQPQHIVLVLPPGGETLEFLRLVECSVASHERRFPFLVLSKRSVCCGTALTRRAAPVHLASLPTISPGAVAAPPRCVLRSTGRQ